MKHIAIIGAGPGGMSAAHDLLKAGFQVTLFEREASVGGLAGGFRDPRWSTTLENFYHHWFESDHAMLGLIEELGWKEDIRFYRPKTVVYYNQRFYPLDTPLAALLFPGFSLIDKVRFGFVTGWLRYFAKWQPLERYSAHEWMRRAYGEHLYQTQFEPMLIGKFSDRYRDVNMAWFWARFKARSTRLGTFNGGFQVFLERFAKSLSERGAQFRFQASITSITPQPDGRITLGMQAGNETFDAVLATTSPRLLADLTPALDDAYRSKLLGLKSIGAVNLILALNHPLSTQGYYWFNLPKTAGFPFLALVEHTNFVPAELFGGDHIIYCGDYLPADHEYFKLSKEELLERFIPSFKRINPDFSPSWVRQTWLFRSAYAQPVPGLNHSLNIPPIQTSLKNLFFASMSQVYPWDRGTNYAVELARQAAAQIISSVR